MGTEPFVQKLKKVLPPAYSFSFVFCYISRFRSRAVKISTLTRYVIQLFSHFSPHCSRLPTFKGFVKCNQLLPSVF